MERQGLSEKLHNICDNVYFQPPESMELTFPCIIYKRRTGDTIYADNRPYRFEYCYTVTVIDSNPDSTIPDQLAMFPMCKMDRVFSSDNLYHTTFILYY